MNESKVRIHAVLVRARLIQLQAISEELRREFEILSDELPTAHPVQDRPFEQFLLRLARANHHLEDIAGGGLLQDAQAMSEYHRSEVGRAVPCAPSGAVQVGRAVPCAPSATIPVVAARCAAPSASASEVGRAVPCAPSTLAAGRHAPLRFFIPYSAKKSNAKTERLSHAHTN